MKAHRFKTKLTTRDEVESDFFKDVQAKIWQVTFEKTKGQGVLASAGFSITDEGIKAIAGAKLDVMKEWEKKGRSLLFLKDHANYNYQTLLQQKHFGKQIS
jgi:hypothetical protein